MFFLPAKVENERDSGSSRYRQLRISGEKTSGRQQNIVLRHVTCPHANSPFANIRISRVPSKIYFSSAEREYIGRSQIYEQQPSSATLLRGKRPSHAAVPLRRSREIPNVRTFRHTTSVQYALRRAPSVRHKHRSRTFPSGKRSGSDLKKLFISINAFIQNQSKSSHSAAGSVAVIFTPFEPTRISTFSPSSLSSTAIFTRPSPAL